MQKRQLNGTISAQTLLVFSAKTSLSLNRLASAHQTYVKERPNQLQDLAYTLSQRREHLTHRSFLIVGNKSNNLIAAPLFKSPTEPPNNVMVFTGQGAQWAGMAVSLIRQDSGFKEDIASLDSVLQSLRSPPLWSISGVLQLP